MKHKERLSVLYDLLFSVLAIVAVYFAIYDMTTGCSAIQRDIDFAINTIFIADYALRLLIAKNKKELNGIIAIRSSMLFRKNSFLFLAISNRNA